VSLSNLGDLGFIFKVTMTENVLQIGLSCLVCTITSEPLDRSSSDFKTRWHSGISSVCQVLVTLTSFSRSLGLKMCSELACVHN